ncbi:hypothetical protein V6N13_088885 [Hibiscus sabdariffa]
MEAIEDGSWVLNWSEKDGCKQVVIMTSKVKDDACCVGLVVIFFLRLAETWEEIVDVLIEGYVLDKVLQVKRFYEYEDSATTRLWKFGEDIVEEMLQLDSGRVISRLGLTQFGSRGGVGFLPLNVVMALFA